ncbi:hypothetical protein F4604DRAFT_1686706 [Suillus subluteus]|nr:hypothetical protein F4604DRAFT_1686706 [Suillus subluteus]
MSSTTLPLAVDCSEKLNVRGNCIAMDIENILIDWPTYMVKFTPKKLGPVKLMIHFKNASKGVWVEDEDSDAETVTVTACKSSSACASTTHDADTTLVSDTPSESKDDMQLISATPVHFIGIPKNPLTLKKRKFGDEDTIWPPRRSRYRGVDNIPISAFCKLSILPAPVVAKDETAARAFPLLHNPFVDIGAVFYDGIRADHGEELTDEDEMLEEHKDRLYCIDVFCDFIKHIPAIITTLSSFEEDLAKLEDCINALRNAASLACAEDTCKLKDLCPSFLLDDPSKPGAALDPPIIKGQPKSLRGWHHKSTARALCPMVDVKRFDEDHQAFMDGILNGKKRPPSFKKLPSCLYDKSLADPKLKHAGFLHGKPLERTFRAIFMGPLTALDPTSRKGTKHPKGVIHGMTEPSTSAIAYAAIQLIVSLSSAEQWTSEVTGLDLYELYLSIVDSLKWIDHPWVKETLDYWTKVAPRLTQTSRRKNGRCTAAASDGSDSNDMDGFLDDPPERPSPSPKRSHGHPSGQCLPPPPEQQQHPLPPPPEQQWHPSPPPPKQQQCPSPPPPEQQHQVTPLQGSHHIDEDDDDRLTPPPLTPLPVTKCKGPPVKRGRGTR